jgi:peptidoglycan/xylan/chitin deacetylase (PgdA/CDA1 family)
MDESLAKTEPWRWPEEKWRGLVSQVRAGRSLKPDVWPSGARCAVALSFDSDHETNELRDGGLSIGRLSWGQYGARVGVPRILALLKKYNVRASFYVPAVAALLHEDEQRCVTAAGHEIGLHGWIHELNSALSYKEERELMLRSADTLEKITGLRPVGMRTPSWDFSPHTLRIDEDCYELLLDDNPSGIIEVPVEWIRDDAAYFLMNRFEALRPYTPPSDVLDIFRREFDGACDTGGLFQLTMHPHIITARSRIWILEEIIRYAASKSVWFATHSEVAAYVKTHVTVNI